MKSKIFALFVFPLIVHAAPDWAKNDTQRFVGGSYEVVCSGSGPSIFHARQVALDECRLSAASAIQQQLKIKAVSIQTEKDTAYHAEIVQDQLYEGLTCVPIKEAVKETDDQARAWLKCRFDLSKVKTATEGPLVKPKIALSNKKRIVISSVPACESILVRGEKPKVIRCKSNPTTIYLEPGDETLIVRAKGYLPKKISASDLPSSLDLILEAGQ